MGNHVAIDEILLGIAQSKCQSTDPKVHCHYASLLKVEGGGGVGAEAIRLGI